MFVYVFLLGLEAKLRYLLCILFLYLLLIFCYCESKPLSYCYCSNGLKLTNFSVNLRFYRVFLRFPKRFVCFNLIEFKLPIKFDLSIANSNI